ncbi:hypothetical protein ACFFHH_16340 [Cytobacillus solani]|uniref:hypothetical protein n=1 Tax=Cytobacillus solani TaxID=1637975 RepID=UPI001152BDA4|nr:hypothetical protein [Cytobacillus solani]
MKKGLILTTGLALLLIGASVGSASEKGFYIFEKPSNTEEQKIQEEIDKANEQFISDVNQDIQSSLKLDLEGYEQIDVDLIFEDEEYLNLANIVMSIMTVQEEGDIIPIVYKNNNDVLILEKKADSTNFVHQFKLNNEKNEWEKVQIEKGKGRNIIHPIESLNIPPTESEK